MAAAQGDSPAASAWAGLQDSTWAAARSGQDGTPPDQAAVAPDAPAEQEDAAQAAVAEQQDAAQAVALPAVQGVPPAAPAGREHCWAGWLLWQQDDC